jgi:hypothetical protein
MVFTLGLRHTLALWQGAMALVQFLGWVALAWFTGEASGTQLGCWAVGQRAGFEQFE